MTTLDNSTSSAPTASAPGLGTYLIVSVFLLTVGCALLAVTRLPNELLARPQQIIAPISALVALTALVWLAMVLSRNIHVLLGRASAQYYIDYATHTPHERIERPARAFNNLLQVPSLFYVACVLGLLTGQLDRVQYLLAWSFVGLRVVHACVYIGWNHLPSRFATWSAGCITLGVIWYRLAISAL